MSRELPVLTAPQRPSMAATGRWHAAINQFFWPETGERHTYGESRWMYDAKQMADEVPRLALLFGYERLGKLRQVHHQCSRDHEGTPVPDNHLTCCLGVECRKCPQLLALERADLPAESIDVAKAWTCAAHIVSSGGDQANEGFVLTTDDRMYWDNVYQSLASGPR